MNKVKSFILTFTLGGLLVILPVIIFIKIILWVLTILNDIATPFISLLINTLNISTVPAQLLTFLMAFLGCFFLGIFVRTKLGKFTYDYFENITLAKVPGYKIIKDIVTQIASKDNSLFKEVVLIRFGEVDMTGFVTDEKPDGNVSVFVPTGPNPTTGMIFHTQKDKLTYLDIPVEKALQSIVSCGAGSQKIIHNGNKQ